MHITRVLLLALAANHAQAEVPAPTQFEVHSWNTKTGLPEETIYSVTQTPDRYLWLANANGLVRYDGNTFQTYQPRQDLGGGVRQEISRLGAGEDNTVWVYSASFGLIRYKQGVFRLAPAYPSPCNVREIQQDGSGTLIVCGERVLRIEGERVEQLTKGLGGPGRVVHSAARDGQGRLWVGFTTGSLAQIGSDRTPAVWYTQRDGMPAGPVNQILAVDGNRVWAATESGLAHVGGGLVKVFTKRDGLPSDHIRRLALTRDKSLWVGTVKGVALRRAERFEVVTTLPFGRVETIFEDREENIWITFTEMNLYRLHKPKFLSWGPPEGLSSERPLAVVQGGDTVWMAQEGKLWRLKDGKLKSIPLGQTGVRYLERDVSGRIWALSESKAFILHPDTEQVLELPVPSDAGRMLTISRDRQGRMWMVGERGLFVGENGRITRVPVENLPHLMARSDVRQSSDGRMWLSVEKFGLFELRDGKAVPVPLGEDPELKRIHTFYIDSNDTFWLGLDGGGLARWKDGKLDRYGHQIGRPHNFVYYFAEDIEGYFWLGLRSGLLRVRRAELNAYFDDRSHPEPKGTYYDLADGLRSFNFGGAGRTVASREPLSVLWFPNLLGLVQIDTRNIPYNRVAPPVHMQEVSADDRVLPLGDTISIPADAEILGLKFSVPTLVARNRMQIRYRLEPFDLSWRSMGFGAVSYTRVPPGSYTFSVSASNNDGVWNEKATKIKVVVLPRFYQTWWFRLLATVLAGLGVTGIYHWRTAILRREKANLEYRVEQRTAELSESMHLAKNAGQAKADFLATMSHEIRTPMHGVLGTLELLSETGLNAQQSEYLNTARASSNSLLVLLNDILDLSKMEAGRMDLHIAPFALRQTVEEVTRLLQAQANVQKIALSLDYAPGLPEFFKGDEMRIRQIVFNLAGNAVKFTTEGKVTIRIGGEQNLGGIWSLRIAIRDSGIGIPQDRIPELFQNFVQVNAAANRRFAGSGLGLAICQRLATMMEGSIAVESEVGRGSTFCLQLNLPEAVNVPNANQAARPVAIYRSFNAHILLAEDNHVNQRLAIKLLADLGCRVTLAQNGREAVRFAEQTRFDLILMDCQMPEMDGFEASRLIRSGRGGEAIIIAVTANSLPGDRERCMEAGMNDYLAKPFQRADLVRLLDLYLPIVPAAVGETASTVAVPEELPIDVPRH